jgi:multisubunit Na+/H+ antiporter MnhE subunit
MDALITIAALVSGLVFAAAMAWLERRPRTGLEPRLLPTTPLMFLGLLVVVLAAAHLLAITGVKAP